jgi:hypothetical protein
MSERTMPATKQISLRKLFFILFVYAALFALGAGCRLPLLEVIAATAVLTLFILWDLRFAPMEQHDASSAVKRAVLVAYYSTAFALAIAACLPAFRFTAAEYLERIAPPPQSEPSSMGEALAAALAPLLHVIARVFMYLLLFALFSFVGFVFSLFAFRRLRLARWLCLANLPGVALFCCFVAGLIRIMNG